MSTTVDANAQPSQSRKPKDKLKNPLSEPIRSPASPVQGGKGDEVPSLSTPPSSPQKPTTASSSEPKTAPATPPPQSSGPSPATIARAVRDVRTVLEEQREQSQILTTKLNILFVANGALLTSLSVSRLMVIPSLFSVGEVVGFLISFTLLVRAFLPRQVAVSPNLEDRKFLERYLALAPDEYELQMLVNLVETYNANKQRLDDITQTLKYGAYATWSVAFVILAHMIGIYFLR
jgi:hypothetical protein